MSVAFRRIPFFALAAAVTILAGCSRGVLQELASDQLFSLSLGRLEDQIDLFQPVAGRNRIQMRDGLFYIANGSADKIMVFSSYGELLFLLYNPATNPTPALASVPVSSDTVSTRGAVSWPFTDIGEIAVASDKTLYVEDAAPAAKVVKDGAGGVFDRVVLRFDRRGNPLGYLGQEGVGGTPFHYVVGLSVTERDQPVVVCRGPAAWEVFWYSREGVLLYQARIDRAHLPPGPEQGLIPALVSVVPDQREPLLHLAVYYYRTGSESQAKNAPDVIAMVHRLDLAHGQYTGSVELPLNPHLKQRVGFKTVEIPRPPYDFLGVGTDGQLYLLGFADSNLYYLAITDPGGRVRARASMVIEDSELAYRDMHLAPSGIIYGLLCDQTKARVAWWRADELLQGKGR
jgi:hypothetical protein